MKRILIVLVVVVAFSSCKKNESITTTTHVQHDVTSHTQVTPDTTASNQVTNNEPVEEGSTLTGNVSNLNVNISLEADQLFDFDKAILKPEAEPHLQNVFDQVNGKTESKLQIIGYTDAKGSTAYNKNLSVKRAEAVKTWLQAKGLKNTIVVEGKGAENPVAPNTKPNGSDNPEGRAKNRRVEIKTITQQSL